MIQDELSFPVDSTILILKREGEWWTGQAEDGSTGLFVRFCLSPSSNKLANFTSSPPPPPDSFLSPPSPEQPHNYLILLPYPPLPSAPPLPSRKPSHLSSASSTNHNAQPPAYPTNSRPTNNNNTSEKSLHSLPPAPTNIQGLPSRTAALPPPPTRGMSHASSNEEGGEEGGSTDYRSQPLRAAYKPSAMDRAKDRGGELRGKLPFGGGGAKPNVPEEKRGMAKVSSDDSNEPFRFVSTR